MGRRDEESMLQRGVVDEGRGFELDGEEGLAVARVDELDAEQEPPTSHLSHDLGALERSCELVAELRPSFAHMLDEASFDQKVDDRQTHGAGQRRAVPGVPQVELARASIDRVVHPARTEHASYRRVSRTEALPDRHD